MTNKSIDLLLEEVEMIDESPKRRKRTADDYAKSIPKTVDVFMREFITSVHRTTGKPNFVIRERFAIMTAKAIFSLFVNKMERKQDVFGYDLEVEYRNGRISKEEYTASMREEIRNAAWVSLWEAYADAYDDYVNHYVIHVKKAMKRYKDDRKKTGSYTAETGITLDLMGKFIEAIVETDTPEKITKTRFKDMSALYTKLITMEGLDAYVYLEDIDQANVLFHKFVGMIRAFDKMLQKIRMTT